MNFSPEPLLATFGGLLAQAIVALLLGCSAVGSWGFASSLLLGLLLTLWICGGSCFTLACQAYPPSSTDQGSNHSPSGLWLFA